MIREACERCGATDLTWADRRFGHCRRRGPAVKIPDRTGYHDGMARTRAEMRAQGDTPLPDGRDPEAYVSSDWELAKLADKRKRQGWVPAAPYDEIISSMEGDDFADIDAVAEQTFGEALRDAEAKGWRTDEEE